MLRSNLKKYREQKGISQTEAGKLVKVSRQTISSIERGEYNPSITLVLKLAELFSARVEDIFWLEENEYERD